MYGEKILIFTLLLFQVTRLTEVQGNDDSTMFRLPNALVPEDYDLSLHIEPENDDFSGTVSITLQLADENTTVDYIYLHADPQFVTITYANLNDVDNCTFENLNNYIVKLFCANITEPEESNVLNIEFNSKYSETDGYGLVKASYTDQRKKQYLIESYFEPTFARRAFPCFDEPDFKSTFSIEITHPAEYTAVSNSITEDYYTFTEDDYTTTTFQPTPRISTYLVSIFVSKFNEESYDLEEEEYAFKFLVRPGFEGLTSKVAGGYHTQIMDTLSNFTGQSFQDVGDSECYQVALPDYYSEHMGNFGLFVYKERDLLDEGDKTTTKATQNILQAMAYKISHEWFGGEVSTTWWSDVWANEAVPMYFKYVIPNQIEEGFEFTNQFVVDVVQKSMQYDAMPFVEALSSNRSEIINEWSIEDKLDQHSLLKGATVLHMINYMVRGEDKFKENLQNHLANRTDSDIDGQGMLKDLIKCDTIQDLYAASEPWAFIAGFPLLIVKIKKTTQVEETLELKQKRFLYPTDNTMTFDDAIKWTIPISYTTSSNKYFDTFINVYYAPNVAVEINIRKDNWVFFNLQGRLPYRVNYDEQLWRRIINALQNETERTEIHYLNRAQVVDDIFNIARTGEVEYSLAFELADFLVYETEYYPWYSAFNAFSYLLGKMKDDDAEEKLKTYILNLMDNVIDVPYPDSYYQENQGNETHIDVLKKVMVLDWACKLGHSECINLVTEEFAKFKENQTSMEDYNLRQVIFCYGLKYSENATVDWKFLWSLYLSSSSVHEQDDILHALGCIEHDRTLQNYLLKLATPPTTSDIKRQDVMVVFESVFSSNLGIKAAMSFLGSSLAYIHFIFNGGTSEIYFLSDMILTLAERLTTDDQLQWLEEILSNKVLNGYDDLKSKARILATVNNYWVKQYQGVIEEILPEVPSTTVTESTSTTESTRESTIETTESTPEPTIETTETTEFTTTEPSTTTESSSRRIFGSHIVVTCFVILFSLNKFIWF